MEETFSAVDFIDYIGPTWKKEEGSNRFEIPKRTLGWTAIEWIYRNVSNGKKGRASDGFTVTPEQGRFLLWFYALDEDGKFLYDESQLQRLKGWGKDPLVCVLSLFEAFGPCRFGGWVDEEKTIPQGVEETLPLIQIAATTQEQTNSTLRLYRHYIPKKTMQKFQIEINTEALKSFGSAVIVSVTSNPEALEGKSPTFVIANETHHWHSLISFMMWQVITRNAVKVSGGTSRILSITNAFDPNLGSVAQQTREAWEGQVSRFGSSRILYDSVEAMPDTPIWAYETDEQGREDVSRLKVEESRERIKALVELVRGDSKWSDINRIAGEFMDTRIPVDLNRRFWLNTVVSSENAWVDLRDFDKCVSLTSQADKRLQKRDKIVLFFDGSKTGDSTVLVASRVSDGLVSVIQAWHKPPKGTLPEGIPWLVPRTKEDTSKYSKGGYEHYKTIETADEAVTRAFRDYSVVAFFADPSHAKEDETNKLYWDSIIDEWHIRYQNRLKVWAGPKSGPKTHSIIWDMASSEKIEEFALFAERTSEMIMRHELLAENHNDLRSHVGNAKVYKTRSGSESIWKGKKNSSKKIDLAVGMVGALMIRSRYLKQIGQAEESYSDLTRFALRAGY